MKFKVWSNILFLAPLYLSVVTNMYGYVIIISFVLIFSTFFHIYDEKRFKMIDIISSLSLITANLILLFGGNLKLPYSLISLLFAGVAIMFYLKQSKKFYNFNHGMWHIFSAIVCYFSVLTFIS